MFVAAYLHTAITALDYIAKVRQIFSPTNYKAIFSLYNTKKTYNYLTINHLTTQTNVLKRAYNIGKKKNGRNLL